jgi:hypothetical protein
MAGDKAALDPPGIAIHGALRRRFGKPAGGVQLLVVAAHPAPFDVGKGGVAPGVARDGAEQGTPALLARRSTATQASAELLLCAAQIVSPRASPEVLSSR